MQIVLTCTSAYAQFHFKRYYEEFLRMGASPLNALSDIDGPVNFNAFALAQHSAAAAISQGPSEIMEGSYVTNISDPSTIAQVEIIRDGVAWVCGVDGSHGKAKLSDLRRCAPPPSKRPATTSNDPHGRFAHVSSTDMNEQRRCKAMQWG